MEDLQLFVTSLFEKTRNCDPDIIRSLFEAEHAIELDYRSRYIFELLQNARDAALKGDVKAKVRIIVEQDRMLVANNGSEFNAEGLRSICRIGLSSKRKNNIYIGNKGLGFKSVLEISSQPSIITRSGTIYFDQTEAHTHFDNTGLKAHELPLLFLPMFSVTTIEEFPELNMFSTIIILPFADGISADHIWSEIKQLRINMFPLLGNFEELEIRDNRNQQIIQYNISYPNKGNCVVQKTGESELRLKLFEHKFSLDAATLEQFSDDEKELVNTDTPIEITIGLRVDKDGKFMPLDHSNLYLFYPLDESSGFKFIVHSLFIVTPNRKNLLDKSMLNKVILKELVSYLSGSFLIQIKKEFQEQAAEILLFTELTQGALSRYNFSKEMMQALRLQPILWNSVANRHLAPSEFYLMSADQFRVFKEPKLGNRYIIYIQSESMRNWLIKTIGAEWLPNHYILTHIEEYCVQQKEKGRFSFFGDLYAFAQQSKLSLRGKRVLLSQNNTLLDQKSQVYYGGHRSDIVIPLQLRNAFTFLHESIKIADIRGNETYTGIIEYNTERLTSKAISMFSEDPTIRPALLALFRNLFSIAPLPSKLMEEILLPVSGQVKWVNAFFHPVYISDPYCKNAFPDGNFIDMEELLNIDNNSEQWTLFLKNCNVWSSPAVYVYKAATISDPDHLGLLNMEREVPLELENDVVIDMPAQMSREFQNKIFDNYSNYSLAISRLDSVWHMSRNGKRIDPYSNSSYYFKLTTCKWVYTNLKAEQAYRPNELFGLLVSDEGQQGMKALQKYHPIVFLPETDIDILSRFGLIPLRKLNLRLSTEVFKLAKINCNGNPPQETDFASAWNKLYGFVFEYWRKATEDDRKKLVAEFEKLALLAESPRAESGRWLWRNGSEILYIDDKPLYDYIPKQINLPPQFTKRDRTEIGALLQRVGIVLSKKITSELLSPAIVKTLPFIEYWHWAKFLLPLVENVLGNNLDSEQIELIRAANVSEVIDLRSVITVSFGISEQYQQRIPYYVQMDEKGVNLLLDINNINTAELAQAANEFLTAILNKEMDIRLQILELSRSSNEGHAMQILNSLNIDTARIGEINELLSIRQITARVYFWNAVAKLFNIEGISEEEEILDFISNLSMIETQLSLEKIKQFEKAFDLNEKWKPEMLRQIGNLLLEAGKSPLSLVPLLEGKADLNKIAQDYYYGLFMQQKAFFVNALFKYLKSKEQEEQKMFFWIITQYSDSYKSCDVADLFEDPLVVLLKKTKELSLLFFPDSFYDGNHTERMDEMRHCNDCMKLLKSKLASEGRDSKLLTFFIENMEMKSLLCFDLGFVYARFLEYLEKHTSESTGVGSSSGTQASTIDTGVNDLSITFTKTRRPGEGQTPSRRSGKGKWPTGSGGFHPSGKRPTQETLEEIGQAGELYVYKKLKEKYIVEWVSVNAELLGYIAKGDDSLGYDMRYADENGNINYIEVKSTSGEAKRFHISTNEVVTGIGLSENYKLIFVVNALDSPSTKAFDLGYIFKGYTSVGEFVNSDSLAVNASEFLVLFEELPEIQ